MNSYRATATETAATETAPDKPVGAPSNEVYARVGDDVLTTAVEGVRGGLKPDEIIANIRERHGIHLKMGEFRLLLASRRVSDQP